MTDPPLAAPYGPGVQATPQLAGFWRRFVAYIVDAIVGSIVTLVVDAIPIVHGYGVDAFGASVRESLVGLVVGFVYFSYLWSRNGQTLGYMVVGVRLVRTDGQPVTFLLAMARYLLIYLSFAICLVPAIISAFMIGLDQRKQGIHDLIVGTLVVRV